MKKIIKLSIISFVLITITSCSSTNKKINYSQKKTLLLKMDKNLVSKDKIDKYKTYEFFFELTGFERCFKIEIKSKEKPNKFTGKIDHKKIFFLIEKIIETKDSKGLIKINYSIIGKNYDSDWNKQKFVNPCLIEGDPIRKFEKKSRFRIRLTSFNKKSLAFNVIISTMNKIVVLQQIK